MGSEMCIRDSLGGIGPLFENGHGRDKEKNFGNSSDTRAKRRILTTEKEEGEEGGEERI